MEVRRVGDQAVLVLGAGPRSAAAIRGTVLELAASGSLPEPRDIVAAATSVLLDGLVGPGAVAAWQSRLEAAPLPELVPVDRNRGRQLTLPTTYDGPDLDRVAEAWSCSREAVVERHQQVVFLVAFCGFAPGFAYCVPDPALPEVPRRDVPRERVPTGSVALAGEYCGIYPARLPGGWQLIGRTPAVLFDPARERPSMLEPGDTVRFRVLG